MDDKYRDPLDLRMMGYSIQEIAEILEITPQNAKVRLVRSCLSERHGRVRRDVRRRLRTERFDLSRKRPRRAALPRPGAAPQ
jgi:DNA-directed RNA polymerase specialized sigma24 family protein